MILTLWWVSPGRPFKEGNASLSREKTLPIACIIAIHQYTQDQPKACVHIWQQVISIIIATSVAFLTFFWDIFRHSAILWKQKRKTQERGCDERSIPMIWHSHDYSTKPEDWNSIWQPYDSQLTSMEGVIPFSSSLTFALRIKPNLSCKWAGNLKVLEFSTNALETPWIQESTITIGLKQYLQSIQEQTYEESHLILSVKRVTTWANSLQ